MGHVGKWGAWVSGAVFKEKKRQAGSESGTGLVYGFAEREITLPFRLIRER